MTAPGQAGVAQVADFLLLQSINGWQNVLAHWADAANLHPEALYTALVQMAGELATFLETRRPNAYPAYRHDDLQRSFAPVVADLRRALSAVLEATAMPIPLREARHGVRVGPITDRSILRASNFVLTVQADVQAEQLRRLFPSQVKIGAVEHIRELVNVALPGIAVRPLPVAPRQLPFYAGATYFELDRASPHWQQMQNSGRVRNPRIGGFPQSSAGTLGDTRMTPNRHSRESADPVTRRPKLRPWVPACAGMTGGAAGTLNRNPGESWDPFTRRPPLRPWVHACARMTGGAAGTLNRHPRESGDPVTRRPPLRPWVPACARMTGGAAGTLNRHPRENGDPVTRRPPLRPWVHACARMTGGAAGTLNRHPRESGDPVTRRPALQPCARMTGVVA